MKGRLIAFVGILCMAILIFSGANAGDKPDKPPGKPDKPGKSHTEWIEFWGDLSGGQPVDGCCPNAGPFPEYRMCLNFEVGGFPAGTCYDGQLFMNGNPADRKNPRYIVQFWKEGTDVPIEIIGGVGDFDKRTRTLTMTFTDELCVDMVTGRPITQVSFTLLRRPY